MNDGQNLEGEKVATLGPVTLAATGDVRMHFAWQHLRAAAAFSRQVGELETANRGEPLGPFFDDILATGSACIFCCTAGLEAYVNEIFADRASHFADVPEPALEYIWQRSERDSTLERLQLCLRLLGLAELDPGTNPFQATARLIDLRNALTHFKPEWSSLQDQHAKLSRKLNACFALSPFIPGEGEFPAAWASHSCTRWAVNTSVAIVKEVSFRTGLNAKLAARVATLTR